MFDEPVLPFEYESYARWVFAQAHDAGISPCAAYRACAILKTVLIKGRTIVMDLDAIADAEYHLTVPPSVVVATSIAFDLESQEISLTKFGALFVEFTHAVALVRSRYVNAQFEIAELLEWKLLPTSPFECLAFAVSELNGDNALLEAAARVIEHAVLVDTLADAHAVAAAAYAVATVHIKRRTRPSAYRRRAAASISAALGVFPHAPTEAQDDAETLADLYLRFSVANTTHSWVRSEQPQATRTPVLLAPHETPAETVDASSPPCPRLKRQRRSPPP